MQKTDFGSETGVVRVSVAEPEVQEAASFSLLEPEPQGGALFSLLEPEPQGAVSFSLLEPEPQRAASLLKPDNIFEFCPMEKSRSRSRIIIFQLISYPQIAYRNRKMILLFTSVN
jgi:hypothetical protein